MTDLVTTVGRRQHTQGLAELWVQDNLSSKSRHGGASLGGSSITRLELREDARDFDPLSIVSKGISLCAPVQTHSRRGPSERMHKYMTCRPEACGGGALIGFFRSDNGAEKVGSRCLGEGLYAVNDCPFPSRDSATTMFARSARGLSSHVAKAAYRCQQCSGEALPVRPLTASFSRTASSSATHHGQQSAQQGNQQGQGARTSQQRKALNLSIKPKPPKRRLEAVSQPLRNAPSSSRGPILQCIAHTTAERYDLAILGGVLRNLGVRWDEVPEGDHDRAFVIGPWKGRGGVERLISGKDARRITLPPSLKDAAEELDEEDDAQNMGFEYGERGEIWVFNNGSFVTWGLTEEEGRAFLRDVIRRKGSAVELDQLAVSEYEVEEVDFVVDYAA